MNRLTILNIVSILTILISFIYMALNWKVLSAGEGWGVIGILGLIGIGILGLITDFLLKKVIANKLYLNLIELLIIILIFFSIPVEI